MYALHGVEPIHRLTASWYDVRIVDGMTRDGEDTFRLQGDSLVGGLALAGAMMWATAGAIMGLMGKVVHTPGNE